MRCTPEVEPGGGRVYCAVGEHRRPARAPDAVATGVGDGDILDVRAGRGGGHDAHTVAARALDNQALEANIARVAEHPDTVDVADRDVGQDIAGVRAQVDPVARDIGHRSGEERARRRRVDSGRERVRHEDTVHS